ncbi:MAG: Gfo/Idh/MocA family oxidoreductase [Kosmotoga sp.]|nr:MAG: Gfo/Idh/MocA family oxidoreductase [Kosmotoga sp.]
MKRIKIGIVGAGTWGETHAYLYNEHSEVELLGVSDLNKAKAINFARKFNIKNVFTDHNEMLKNVDLDAVAIVTPDYAHGKIVEDCASAGKHMIVEKPLATDKRELAALAEAFKKSNVRIMTDLHNRWSPPFAVAKESIDKGELGTPISAYFRLNDCIWVATDMLPWVEKSSILWFLGTHSVDTLRWFFDDEVESVYSVSNKGVLKNKGIDTVDIYQTILRFRNGGIATMENSWITPNTNPNVNDIKFNITGSKGMINMDLSNSQLIEKYTEEKGDNPDVLVRHFIHGKAKGFAYESIRHFIECLVSGDDFLVSLEDAVNTSLVVLAIMESAKTGSPVNVEYL